MAPLIAGEDGGIQRSWQGQSIYRERSDSERSQTLRLPFKRGWAIQTINLPCVERPRGSAPPRMAAPGQKSGGGRAKIRGVHPRGVRGSVGVRQVIVRRGKCETRGSEGGKSLSQFLSF